MLLTKDYREVEKMFRLAVFNVLAHNRDDHSKNFSFLMDTTGKWQVSPAYDLTFSSGPQGEHSTMVMGEGKVPTVKHLTELAMRHGITNSNAKEIMGQVQEAINTWPHSAEEAGVCKKNVKHISERLLQISHSFFV